MNRKVVKYGEKGCGKVECEGPQHFIAFIFSEFKPRNSNNYAELFNEKDELVATTKAAPTP